MAAPALPVDFVCCPLTLRLHQCLSPLCCLDEGKLPDLLHSLDVLSKLGVKLVGGDLLVLAILHILSSVQEPLRESMGFWVGDDLSDLVDLFFGEFTSSLSDVDSGLLAQGDSESPAQTSDGSDGVWHQSLAVQVRVEHTDNVLEAIWVLYVQALALSKFGLPSSSTLNRFYKNWIKRMNGESSEALESKCLEELM